MARRWRTRARLRIAAVLAAGLAACGGSTPVTVWLVGDSITEGWIGGGAGRAYPARLAEELGAGYVVWNLGVQGAATVDWLRPELFGAIRAGSDADVAAVLLGTNDALGFPDRVPLPPSAYGAALRALVERLVAAGVEHVILMTPPPTPNPRGVERLPAYREQVQAICRSAPRTRCGPDLFRELRLERDFDPHDPVHPNDRGHARIAEALAGAIRAVAEER